MAEGQAGPGAGPVWILAAVLSVGAGGYFAYHTGAAIAGDERSEALAGIGALALIGAVLGAIRMGGIGSSGPSSGTDGRQGNADEQDERAEEAEQRE